MNKKIMMGLLAIGAISLSSQKVSSIEITNLKDLPESIVREVIPIRVGDEYSNKILSDIYLDLGRTGLVQNVNIYPTSDGDNVNLKLVVDEYPNVKEILQQREEIAKLQEKTGLKINSIKYRGTNFNLNDVFANSNVKIGNEFTVYDAKVLENQIMATGYFASVETQISRNAENKTVDIVYNIVENPRIVSVSIKGSSLFTEEQLIAASGLNLGEVLNTKLIALDTAPLLKVYTDNGYLWVGYKNVSITNNGRINIELQEGKVSEIIYEKKGATNTETRISDNDYKLKTKDYILERNTYINKNKILNIKNLETTLRELFRTGLFSSVNHEIVQDPKDQTNLIVKIILSERPTTVISGNVSYSTEDSLTGSLKLSDSNFLGREQSFDLTGEAGIKGNYNLSLSYKDPWVKGTDRLVLGGSVYFKKTSVSVKDSEDYKKDPTKETEEKLLASNYFAATDRQYIFGINGQIGKGLTRDIYLTVNPRIVNVNSKNKVSEEKVRTYLDYTLGAIGSDLIYDTRDDRNTPKNGIYADLYVEGGYIFRDNSLIKGEKNVPLKDEEGNYVTQKPRAYATTTLDLRAYHSVFGDKNSMAYRLLGSYSHSNTPSGQLAVAGDGTTFRGLQESKADNKYMLAISVENRTYINDYIQAVAFYDGGIAEQIKQNGAPKFINNVGLGARINTPVGILRLDYAWDLDATNSKDNKIKGKFNFGFGQTF